MNTNTLITLALYQQWWLIKLNIFASKPLWFQAVYVFVFFFLLFLNVGSVKLIKQQARGQKNEASA